MTTAPATLRRGYAETAAGQIHFRRIDGETGATPLLLLHPSPLSGIVWDGFMGEMGRDRIVIAPDTPGFGESPPPAAAPEISDYAATMSDLLDAEDLEVVDVMGYHTGSLTAVEMALRCPERIRKVVMISATIFTEKERASFRTQYAPKSLEEKGEALVQSWAFMNSFWPEEPDLARRWDIFLEAQRHHAHSHWGHNAAFNYDLEKNLKEVNHPVLILNPEDDLWDYTPRAAPLLKNGRVHDLPGWTHGFLDARTSETATLVREFLDT